MMRNSWRDGVMPHKALKLPPKDYGDLADNLSDIKVQYMGNHLSNPVTQIQAELLDDAISVLRAYQLDTAIRPWRWIMVYLKRWF